MRLLRPSIALVLVTLATPLAADQAPSGVGPVPVRNAATAKPGPRTVPGRAIPVPTTVSPEMAVQIGAPYPPGWDVDPKTPEAWKAMIAAASSKDAATIPVLREQFGVTSEATEIDGVKAYVITPKEPKPDNKNRVLINLHGGAYVFGAGEAGTVEAILMAGIGGYKVIAVDYRMPPDAPYPAAMDDAVTVYKAALRQTSPQNIGVFGTSTGGGMTLALMLRLKSEGLPLPGAMAPGTPWADLT